LRLVVVVVAVVVVEVLSTQQHTHLY